MQWIKFAFKQFLKEPLWFKTLIILTLLISIIFSNSIFSENPIHQSISKLAAAIFFIIYGVKMRKKLVHSVIFFTLAFLCVVLSLLVII